MPVVDFERARQPEQKELRREAILEAAAALLEEKGLHDISLSAIARKAKLSKANLYRYFESREAIFLELLRADYDVIAKDFEKALLPLAGSGDVEGVANAIAKSLASAPRALELLASVASILEHNVSADYIRDFKREIYAISARPVFAVHAALPDLPFEKAFEVVHMVILFAGGLYPSANPPPIVAEVMAEPEFCQFAFDFEPTLATHARLLLRGALAESAS